MLTRNFTIFFVIFFTYGYCVTTLEDDFFAFGFQSCKRNDARYSTCLKNAMQRTWPMFAKGNLGSPSLDPWEVGKVERHFKVGQLTCDMVVTNSKIYGLANTRFLTVQPTFTKDRIKLEFLVETPKLFVYGNYRSSGVYNKFINVHGVGYSNVTLDHVTGKWVLDGRIENDKWIIEKFEDNTETKSMTIYFSDLFNGNRRLNNAVVSMVNKNWSMFFKGMKPTIEDISNVLVKDIMNRYVFSKAPVSKTFG